MLPTIFSSIERTIVAQGKSVAAAGHSIHKGTPREVFVRDFLSGHLPARTRIGSGEVVDCNSRPGVIRNQHDIVLYRDEYPRICFGADLHGFLAESVVATIEVKSTLDEGDVVQAVGAARALKSLQRNFRCGDIVFQGPPAILTYVVAYDGPKKMSTVHRWIQNAHASLGTAETSLPTTREARLKTPSPSIDGVFLLQRGALLFNNTALGLSSTTSALKADARWAMAETTESNLLLLFMLLTSALGAEAFRAFDPGPYVSAVRLNPTYLS